MRKLIASLFTTLDGFISGPNQDMAWTMDIFNDEMGKYAGDLQGSMGAILLGRVTYQIMSGFWPTAGDDVPGAERMNNVPKIVFSRTLDKVEWGRWGNARLVKDNIADEVARLKKQPGKDMVIYGSGSIVRTLMALGLIDEYQFLVHPIVLGSGKALFQDIAKPINLRLLRTESFKNGVVVLYYQPAQKAS